MKDSVKNMYQTYMNVKKQPEKKQEYALGKWIAERERKRGERQADTRNNK